MRKSEEFDLFAKELISRGDELEQRAYMAGTMEEERVMPEKASSTPHRKSYFEPIKKCWDTLDSTVQEGIFLGALLLAWMVLSMPAGIQALTFIPIIRATRSGGKIAGFVLAMGALLFSFAVYSLSPGHVVNLSSFVQLSMIMIAYVSTIGLVDSMVNRLHRTENLALTDPLTGCYNRLGFATKLDQTLSHLLVEGGNAIVVVLDLDEFKPLNDIHGHQFGDQVLRTLVKSLQPTLSLGGGILGRTGGDEFQMIFTGSARREIEEALDRAGKRFSDQTLVLGHRSTFSFGISESQSVGYNSSLLIEVADIEMYRRKAARNFEPGLRLA